MPDLPVDPATGAPPADAGGGPPVGRRSAIESNLRTLFPYAVAFVLFVAFGVADPRFMLNWSPGILLLLFVVWGIPALWRRWRAR